MYRNQDKTGFRVEPRSRVFNYYQFKEINILEPGYYCYGTSRFPLLVTIQTDGEDNITALRCDGYGEWETTRPMKVATFEILTEFIEGNGAAESEQRTRYLSYCVGTYLNDTSGSRLINHIPFKGFDLRFQVNPDGAPSGLTCFTTFARPWNPNSRKPR